MENSAHEEYIHPSDNLPCYVVLQQIGTDETDKGEVSSRKLIAYGPASNVDCGGWLVMNAEQLKGQYLMLVMPVKNCSGLAWMEGARPLDDTLTMETFDSVFGSDKEFEQGVQAREIAQLKRELECYKTLWRSTANALFMELAKGDDPYQFM